MDDLKNFNPEGSILRCHQKRMFEILCVVDDICKKNKINYWLSSGTLLGAVRHKGFIPWDDDLDIEMFREDYLKFIKTISEELPDNLKLQTVDTDLNYVAPYAKIRDLNSRLYETRNKDCNYKYRGIYIDVFNIEPNLPLLVKISSKLHGHLYNFSYNSKTKSGFLFFCKRLYLFCLQYVTYPLFRFFSKIFNAKRFYQCLGAGFLGERKKNDILPLVSMNFEGRNFPVPNDSHAYLTRIYGDYMKIPDLSKVEKHLDKIELF